MPGVPDVNGGSKVDQPREASLPDLLVTMATQSRATIVFIEDSTLLESIGELAAIRHWREPLGQQKLANIELFTASQGFTSRLILEKRHEQIVHLNARNCKSLSHGRRVARCERAKPQRGHAGTIIERLELSIPELVYASSRTSVLSFPMWPTLWSGCDGREQQPS